MKHYELLCVLPGTLTEDEVKPVEEKVRAVLEEQGVQNIQFEDLGKNRLAYPIKHIRYGYFRLFLFESESDKLAGIQAKLKMFPELLRAMVNIYDPQKRKESKINYVTERPGVATITKPETAKETPVKEDVPVAKKEEVKEPEKKVDMKEIDEQLDKILQTDISSV